MKQLTGPVVLGVIAILLSACASPQIPTRAIDRTEPGAASLVAAAQRAHGQKAFTNVRDIRVRYDGRWSSLGPRFQPVLADTQFRRGSEEHLLLRPRRIAQLHSGPAGTKFVEREPGKVVVEYNGKPSSDDEVRRAAALVADAYTLFLLGPFYFDRRGVTLVSNGEEVVDKVICDKVLAVLRPGFGFSDEDRVILFIDRASRQLRRVRMTLNGLESTRGAEVDVTFRSFRKVGGVLWPTDFDERIRVPFALHAHHWRMLDLEVNRGFGSSDLKRAGSMDRRSVPRQ